MADHEYTVRFREPAGDVPLLVADTSRFTGTGARVEIEGVEDGSDTDMWLEPIPAHLFRVQADRPTVSLIANDIAAVVDPSVSYSFVEALVPSISSITPASVTAGDELTVVLDNVDTDANASVSIGPAACVVTATSSERDL